MDMTIELLETKLKPIYLKILLPSSSTVHLILVTPLLFFGSLATDTVLRIFSICSKKEDVQHWLQDVYGHILDRGFNSKNILPIFDEAINNVIALTSRSDCSILQQHAKQKAPSGRRIAFHLKYHPADPPSRVTQQLFKDCIFEPAGEKILTQLISFDDRHTPTDGIVLAYSRPLNISNLLSYRKIHNRPGSKVSSCI